MENPTDRSEKEPHPIGPVSCNRGKPLHMSILELDAGNVQIQRQWFPMVLGKCKSMVKTLCLFLNTVTSIVLFSLENQWIGRSVTGSHVLS